MEGRKEKKNPRSTSKQTSWEGVVFAWLHIVFLFTFPLLFHICFFTFWEFTKIENQFQRFCGTYFIGPVNKHSSEKLCLSNQAKRLLKWYFLGHYSDVPQFSESIFLNTTVMSLCPHSMITVKIIFLSKTHLKFSSHRYCFSAMVHTSGKFFYKMPFDSCQKIFMRHPHICKNLSILP